MCIFSGSVENVAATKILVSKVYRSQIVEQKQKNGRIRRFKKPVGNPLQLTVYSNKVVLDHRAHDSLTGNRGGTAMILPFPLIKGQNRVAVLNMENYENFFDDIELLFPVPQSREMNSYSLTDAIEVMKVGSYKVSIVRNFDDFKRLQFSEFNLDPDVTKLLGQFYGKNYGFMVCVLRPQARYHPFAYVHEVRSNGELFVPTRHYHGNTASSTYGTTMGHSVFGKFHDRTTDHVEDSSAMMTADRGNPLLEDLNLKNNFYDTLMDGDEYISHQMRRTTLSAPDERKKESDLDWDHEIFIVNRPSVMDDRIFHKAGITMLRASPGRIDQVENYINFKRMPTEIAFGSISDMVKVSINKLYTGNHDLFV